MDKMKNIDRSLFPCENDLPEDYIKKLGVLNGYYILLNMRFNEPNLVNMAKQLIEETIIRDGIFLWGNDKSDITNTLNPRQPYIPNWKYAIDFSNGLNDGMKLYFKTLEKQGDIK